MKVQAKVHGYPQRYNPKIEVNLDWEDEEFDILWDIKN